MKRTRWSAATLSALALLLPPSPPDVAAGDEPRGGVDYAADVAWACDRIAEECSVLIEAKRIAWGKVRAQFVREAKGIRDPEVYMAFLLRLLARLQDGHAAVLRTSKTEGVKSPGQDQELKGPGLFLCRVGTRVYVKNAWAGAARVGIEPGLEVVKVDGKPTARWLAARLEDLRDRISFPSSHNAEQAAFHSGLAEPAGTRVDYVLRDLHGKQRKRTVVCERAGFSPKGPAFPPAGLKGGRDVTYGTTSQGYGYIHYARCKSNIPYRTDDALRALGNVPGLILDFRACGGGGFSHPDLMGRFIPAGKTIEFTTRYTSRGDTHYAGPIVVIVDGLTRSVGETAAGMFKEDGRAFMIGESPTAGMAASRTTFDLPSGLFQIHVSVRSSMQRFNAGRGIEGLGVSPHAIVRFDPVDLAAGRDTLIRRAEAILADWPPGTVPYDPRRYGWKPP